MFDFTQRTELLIGDKNVKKLEKSSVLVFGIGGVGSYCVEMLVRAGIGKVTLFDGDVVNKSNLNRQLIALRSTEGMYKCLAMKERVLDINPQVQVEIFNEFYTFENADIIDFSKFNYIADAIDMVASKILIIERAQKAGVPIISAMGAGNKMDPMGFAVKDIYETTNCPLARVLRRELRKKNISKLKVVFSEEKPYVTYNSTMEAKKPTIGSISFVPSVAGIIMASEIIKDIIR